MTLKRLLRLTLVLSAALYVGCSDAGNHETAAPPMLKPAGEVAKFQVAATPKPLAKLAFTGAGDKWVTLGDFRGKTVLLNFWATWCAPCKVEMPSLDRLQARLGGDDFAVVAISSDRAGAKAVDPYFEQNGIRLARYYDPRNAAGMALGVTGLPTSILIDKDGRELGRLLGDAKWDSPDAVALVKQAMGK